MTKVDECLNKGCDLDHKIDQSMDGLGLNEHFAAQPAHGFAR